MKLLTEEITELSTEEKELIVIVRQFLSKDIDVEVRRNKEGKMKILTVKKKVRHTE